MIAPEDDIAHRLEAVHLDHRTLWLDAAHTLGQVAETLAAALAWQPSEDEPLPDALHLAALAATRLRGLEGQIIAQQPTLKARREREYA